MINPSIHKHPITDGSGKKYLRTIYPADGVGKPIKVDVYCVLTAFNVTCPARQHAAKKILCAGVRGKGSRIQDLQEVMEAMWRALDLQEQQEEADAR